VLVEAIKNNQQVYGEEGEMVCTDLTNYTMPFIRYELGDIVVLSKEKCSCGKSFPLIKLIQGRSNDFITLPSGKIMPPIPLIITLEKIEGISQFKLLQENINVFDVQIVKGQNFKETAIEEVKHALIEILGRGTRISVNIVDEIPREKSGKVRPIVSKLPVSLLKE
jgi:phenylacetate-CoA ligase